MKIIVQKNIIFEKVKNIKMMENLVAECITNMKKKKSTKVSNSLKNNKCIKGICFYCNQQCDNIIEVQRLNKLIKCCQNCNTKLI